MKKNKYKFKKKNIIFIGSSLILILAIFMVFKNDTLKKFVSNLKSFQAQSYIETIELKDKNGNKLDSKIKMYTGETNKITCYKDENDLFTISCVLGEISKNNIENISFSGSYYVDSEGNINPSNYSGNQTITITYGNVKKVIELEIWKKLSSPEDFEKYNDYIGNYELSADITLKDNKTYKTIGCNDNNCHAFTGKFNGNNHTINNAYFSYQSIFYKLGPKAEIKNFNLNGKTITTNAKSDLKSIGTIARTSVDSTISNVHVNTSILGENVYDTVGGIVGESTTTTIEKSSYNGEISSNNYSGGIVGLDYGTKILHDYTKGKIIGDKAGGFIGYSRRNKTTGIIDSYTAVSVKKKDSNSKVGALIGELDLLSETNKDQALDDKSCAYVIKNNDSDYKVTDEKIRVLNYEYTDTESNTYQDYLYVTYSTGNYNNSNDKSKFLSYLRPDFTILQNDYRFLHLDTEYWDFLDGQSAPILKAEKSDGDYIESIELKDKNGNKLDSESSIKMYAGETKNITCYKDENDLFTISCILGETSKTNINGVTFSGDYISNDGKIEISDSFVNTNTTVTINYGNQTKKITIEVWHKITSAEDFEKNYGIQAGNYELENDITFESGKTYKTIGCIDEKNDNDCDMFAGKFNGKNHAINNAQFSHQSMFYSLHNAEIKNLTLNGRNIQTTIRKKAMIGTIARDSLETTIDNVHVNINIIGNGIFDIAGGLVGKSSNTTIEKSSYNGEISSNNYSGGIVGLDYGTKILHCYTKGKIIGDKAGGFIGYSRRNKTTGIIDSYTAVSVKKKDSNSKVGALIGELDLLSETNKDQALDDKSCAYVIKNNDSDYKVTDEKIRVLNYEYTDTESNTYQDYLYVTYSTGNYNNSNDKSKFLSYLRPDFTILQNDYLAMSTLDSNIWEYDNSGGEPTLRSDRAAYKYLVKYSVDNAIIKTTESEAGLTIQIPTISGAEKEGYILEGWQINGTGTVYKTGDTFTMPSNNVKLTAVYKKKNYNINYDANGGTNAPESTTLEYESVYTIPNQTPTKEGYKFLGWATSSNGAVKYKVNDKITITSTVNLYAVWEKVQYEVTYKDKDGNKITTVKVNKNTNYTVGSNISAPQITDYTFSGWKNEDDSKLYSIGSTYLMPTKDISFKAEYTKNNYSITSITATSNNKNYTGEVFTNNNVTVNVAVSNNYNGTILYSIDKNTWNIMNGRSISFSENMNVKVYFKLNTTESTIKEFDIKIDKTNPTISVYKDNVEIGINTIIYNTSVFEIRYSDELSGIKNADIKLDNVSQKLKNNTLTIDQVGEHTLNITVTDNASNTYSKSYIINYEKELSTDKVKIIDNSGYKIGIINNNTTKNNVIKNVTDNSDLEKFKTNFSKFDAKVYQKGLTIANNKINGTLVTSGNVGTGMVIVPQIENVSLDACYTIIVKGDLTGDGQVKINDVTKLYKKILNKNNLNIYEEQAADVTNDGQLKINDITKMYKYVLNVKGEL